jgi:hypothetical protein
MLSINFVQLFLILFFMVNNESVFGERVRLDPGIPVIGIDLGTTYSW